MKAKRKNNILNLIMVLIILLIILCGVMAVGNIKGWFDKDVSYFEISKLTGVSFIERDNVSYDLKSDSKIKTGDKLTVANGGSLNLDVGGNKIYVNDNSIIKIESYEENKLILDVLKGDVFLDIDEESISVKLNGKDIILSSGVYSFSAQTGSGAISVFSGSSELNGVKANEEEALSVIGDDVSKLVLQIESLNSFNLKNVELINETKSLCFTNDDIKELEARRLEEKKKAEEAIKNEVTKPSGNSSSGNNNSGNESSTENKTLSCTITIRCDTILDNLEDLTSGKDIYVPENGVIISQTRVEFLDGETVFDVLKRLCDYTGTQLEYSYTALYGSYYIEGINHLYEFDCGNESGWMYKVNGWFPNYGCSAYYLKDGDNIVWCYTCKGLGADVGGSVY